MITPNDEYFNNQWLLNSVNPPHLAILLPASETIYEINLNKRTVKGPDYVSVEQDHQSEIIYFKVDRYYDTMDLSDTICIIQYTNKSTKKSGCYAVPFYDIITLSIETEEEYQPKILFPWCIDGLASEKAGILEYSIRFLKVGEDNKIIYNLNTIPTQTKILTGLNPNNFQEPIQPDATTLENLLNRVSTLEKDYELYWEIVE